MRALGVLLVLLLSGLSGGCYVVSLTGLSDASTTVFDESLLGRWQSVEDEATLEVGRGDWQTYSVLLRDRTGEQRFTARLTTVGGMMLFDATVPTGIETSQVLLPVHVVGRVRREDRTLSLQLLNYEWFRGRLSRGSLTVPAVLNERDAIVITATRLQFRRWLASHVSLASSMFEDVMTLTLDEGKSD